MYLDFLLFTCILHVSQSAKESKVHLRYTSDTSKYMYLMRFLDVTLDTYQDTSEYMYLGHGLFITIHQDTPRYKITIHVNFLVRGGFAAKRCRTCGLLKFGRQGPGVKMPVAAVRA